MPESIALGHVMAALALVALATAIWLFVSSMRESGFERGTPQYAHSRLTRRYALYALAVAILLGALCLTPLCDAPLLEI